MEIKNLSDDKKIIGTNEVLNLLKKKQIRKIFLTKNTPKFILAQIIHIAKLTDAQLVYLKHTNNELGIVCRKPFGISVLGVLK
jgi:ribosomal protein L30E